MRALVKRISALLLAASFFLPLAQCSQKVGDTSAPLTISASNAYEWPSMFSTVALLLFFWPLALQIWRAVMRAQVRSRKASWAEFGLSVLSLAGISWLILPWLLNFGASILYGAFLAYGSVLVYGATSFVEGIKGGPGVPLSRLG